MFSNTPNEKQSTESQDQIDSVLKPASKPHITGFSLQNTQNIKYAYKESGKYLGNKSSNIFPYIERAPYAALGEYPNHSLLHFSRYIHRFETFRNWPKSHPIAASDLCQAGFLYTGQGDKVHCPWCRIMLIEWESYDRPLEEHKRHSPMCDFVKMITP